MIVLDSSYSGVRLVSGGRKPACSCIATFGLVSFLGDTLGPKRALTFTLTLTLTLTLTPNPNPNPIPNLNPNPNYVKG